jgi:hypothetical protein
MPMTHRVEIPLQLEGHSATLCAVTLNDGTGISPQ